MKAHYQISGIEQVFSTLKSAKDYIGKLSFDERFGKFGYKGFIIKIGKQNTCTEVMCDLNGIITYSRTKEIGKYGN